MFDSKEVNNSNKVDNTSNAYRNNQPFIISWITIQISHTHQNINGYLWDTEGVPTNFILSKEKEICIISITRYIAFLLDGVEAYKLGYKHKAHLTNEISVKNQNLSVDPGILERVFSLFTFYITQTIFSVVIKKSSLSNDDTVKI